MNRDKFLKLANSVKLQKHAEKHDMLGIVDFVYNVLFRHVEFSDVLANYELDLINAEFFENHLSGSESKGEIGEKEAHARDKKLKENRDQFNKFYRLDHDYQIDKVIASKTEDHARPLISILWVTISCGAFGPEGATHFDYFDNYKQQISQEINELKKKTSKLVNKTKGMTSPSLFNDIDSEEDDALNACFDGGMYGM